MSALLNQLWPLALFMVLIALLVRLSQRKRRQEQVQRNTTSADLRGMAYSAPSGEDVGGLLRGTHRFDGSTRGVTWWAETLYLTDQATGSYAQTHNQIQNYTRWTAPNIVTGGGTLLLMNLPHGVQAPAVGAAQGKSGFLAAMADKAAAAALQLFARVTFGNTRSTALPLEPHHRVPLGGDAFADRPELLQRLGPAAHERLLAERDNRVALLWDAQGLTLTWPTAHMATEELAACAEYGATLAQSLVP